MRSQAAHTARAANLLGFFKGYKKSSMRSLASPFLLRVKSEISTTRKKK